MEYAVEIQNLSKDYETGFWRKKKVRALDDLTLNVRPGQQWCGQDHDDQDANAAAVSDRRLGEDTGLRHCGRADAQADRLLPGESVLLRLPDR